MKPPARLVSLTFTCALFAATPRAQAPNLNIPIDKELSDVTSKLTLMGAVVSLPLAPVTFLMGEGLRQFAQAGLWRMAMDADSSVMSAWTMESLLQIGRQVYGSLAVVKTLQEKIKSDLEPLRRASVDSFREGATDESRALNEAALEAVTRTLEDLNRPPFSELAERGARLESTYADLRRMVVGGGIYPGQKKAAAPAPALAKPGDPGPPPPLVASYFTPLTMQKNWDLASQLVQFMTIAGQLESLLTSTRKTPVTVNGRMQEREVVPSSKTHVRLLLTNQSADLVFFIRVSAPGTQSSASNPVLQQGDGGSSRWLTLYPQGSSTDMEKPTAPSAQQSDAGAGVLGGDKVDFMTLQLPTSVWLPISLGDQLDVRVATYGEERKKIRWMPLQARLAQLRPEMISGSGGGMSITRSFYYLGFTLAYDMVGRTTVRHFSTREDYAWTLEGAWKDKTEFVRTDRKDIREVTEALFPLELRNDHLRWTLPTDLVAVKAQPQLSASVTGSADFAFRTAKLLGPNAADGKEKGHGDINILMQIW